MDDASLRVYTPEDFARFVPRNARDMIDQIPGFSVQEADDGDEGRGFGEASGNLLINGKRISSKSTTVADQLSRIPAGNVVRIEIVDGASLDIPGLSGRVANIIAETGSLSGQFSWQPRISTGPAPIGLTEGEISVQGKAGAVAYTIALDSGGYHRGAVGPAIFTDAAGVLDARENERREKLVRPELSGAFAFDLAPDVSANLNLTGGIERLRYNEDEFRIPENPMPYSFEIVRTRDKERFYEIGLDVEFPLGPGRLKLIGLEGFEHGDFTTRSLLDVEGGTSTGRLFTRVSDQGERIARSEYSWAMLGGDWQLSAEAAFNRLDQEGRLFSYDDASGEYIEVALPSGTGGVRESRYESILSHGRPLTGRLALQIALGGEYSRISQTGANALSRSFQRPKGSLALAWNVDEGFDVSLEVARRVGQLNFGDFLASVNLSQDNSNVGNSQLRPQQSWETELEISKSLGPWGSLTLLLFDQRIEDLIVVIPLQGGGEGQGNLANSRRYGLELNSTLRLDPIGFAGAQLVTQFAVEDSSLTDPVTQSTRRFDGNDSYKIELDFRHDVPRTDWAWGLNFRHTRFSPKYRLDEVSLEHIPPTFAAAFIEHKDVFGLSVNTRFGNVLNAKDVLDRTVYDGPRDTAPVLFTESRRRYIKLSFEFGISGSF